VSYLRHLALTSLSGMKLNITVLSTVKLILNLFIVMLSVVMLSVVAPFLFYLVK
jgi:hypothetical protein